jgi:hypothetical protein
MDEGERWIRERERCTGVIHARFATSGGSILVFFFRRVIEAKEMDGVGKLLITPESYGYLGR